MLSSDDVLNAANAHLLQWQRLLTAGEEKTREEISDKELAGWARNWHWNDCAEDKPIDPSIYFRDMRMLKAFIVKFTPLQSGSDRERIIEECARWHDEKAAEADAQVKHHLGTVNEIFFSTVRKFHEDSAPSIRALKSGGGS